MSPIPSTVNCKGRLLDISDPIVMGILNVTPDSFYDGGKYTATEHILFQADRMLEEGANVLDIGGMSSRPGAELISVQQELQRVLPAIDAIKQAHPDALISIDTVRAEVARQAIEAGASIINDISAGRLDEDLYAAVAEMSVPYVLMHMQGKPETMQDQPQYEDIIVEVYDFFVKEIEKLRALEVKDIILDVGFGFGKSIEHNYRLLGQMHQFETLGLPLLAGISRKSMIYKVLETSPQKALNGTSALHLVALQQGAKILRAHDVQEAVEVIKLWKQLEVSNYSQNAKLLS